MSHPTNRTVQPTPGSLSAGEAALRSEPLSALLERLQQSRQRLECVSPLLPAGLQTEVRAGPLDDKGWLLFVPGNAAAAKLRQCLPLLEEALLQQGWPKREIKVRILAAPQPPAAPRR